MNQVAIEASAILFKAFKADKDDTFVRRPALCRREDLDVQSPTNSDVKIAEDNVQAQREFFNVANG